MILPMIDVPVSLIGTFAVMAAMGFTLNNLTLFGLVLAIGIVVDDAIVVLENIERLIATGLDARTATIKAMEEITGPILAITLVLSSVFIPCCFLGGITRPVLPPVRGDDRRLDDHLGHQRPDHDARRGPCLIFKTEEGSHGHELKREALPWWIFGVVGGLLDRLAGPGRTWPAGSACRRRRARPTSRGLRAGCPGRSTRRLFRPRRAGRRRDRLAHHPARERRAGLALPRLQPPLRPDDRGLRPDGRPACCG